jgi:hypothetical protein
MNYDETDLYATLDKIEAQLRGGAAATAQALGKSVGDLAADMTLHHAFGQARQARMQKDIDTLKRTVAEAERTGMLTQKKLRKFARGVWKTLEARRRQEHAPHTEPAVQRPEANAQIAKAIGRLLPDASLQDAVLAGWALKKSLGGDVQVVPFNRELCGRLRLHKAISREEEGIWEKTDLLPSRVNVQQPQPAPEPPPLYAFTGVAAMALPRHLLMGRR